MKRIFDTPFEIGFSSLHEKHLPLIFFLSDFGRLQKDSIFLLLKEAKSWKLVQLARHAHVHVHSQFQEAKSALVYVF